MHKLALLSLFAFAACNKPPVFDESKSDLARLTVKKYAAEAYPMWSMSHPEKACPEKLEDFDEYMNRKDTKDPWGNPYKMLCGASLPAGQRGVQVVSNGADGKEGTPDDVKSWDPAKAGSAGAQR